MQHSRFPDTKCILSGYKNVALFSNVNCNLSCYNYSISSYKMKRLSQNVTVPVTKCNISCYKMWHIVLRIVTLLPDKKNKKSNSSCKNVKFHFNKNAKCPVKKIAFLSDKISSISCYKMLHFLVISLYSVFIFRGTMAEADEGMVHLFEEAEREKGSRDGPLSRNFPELRSPK